jgi:hypothetical protein
MSQTCSLFKNLFNTNIKHNVVNLSTQELYSIYTNVKKINPQLTFSEFIKLFQILRKGVNLFAAPTTLLGFFFFFKTTPLITLVSVLNVSTNTSANLFLPNGKSSTVLKFSGFWKKFKKLKRPATEKNFNEYFLLLWEKKLNTYSNIGFLKTVGNFYVNKLSTEIFTLTSVQTSKPLLIAPKFSSTSINKFLNVSQLDNFEFQFLRKNKVYNKGRYSRCRQNYRTGVYMCMYLSVCSIFGLYYWFYKFTFNFSYLWWFFIAFFGSFLFPKIVKYRLYEPTTLVNKFFDFFKWIFSLVRSLFF